MDMAVRIERSLSKALEPAACAECPPGLAGALRHAVFPGGARIRPRLCLAVASACGDDDQDLSDAAAAAIELLHSASLVHDDLPCFDDAPLRRGKPSVHRAYGERLAVLAGDGLIVRAFEIMALAGRHAPERVGPLVAVVARAVSFPSGIVAGQAWECEPRVNLSRYHRAKTGALFVAATEAGALAAGADPTRWRALGELLGEAYQVADDICDAAGECETAGKPVGRDADLGRPSAAAEFGIKGAVDRLEKLVAAAVASIPPCCGETELRHLVVMGVRRLIPKVLMPRSFGLYAGARPGDDGQPWVA